MSPRVHVPASRLDLRFRAAHYGEVTTQPATLALSQENLPWVLNAYVLAFGGFLLLLTLSRAAPGIDLAALRPWNHSAVFTSLRADVVDYLATARGNAARENLRRGAGARGP